MCNTFTVKSGVQMSLSLLKTFSHSSSRKKYFKLDLKTEKTKELWQHQAMSPGTFPCCWAFCIGQILLPSWSPRLVCCILHIFSVLSEQLMWSEHSIHFAITFMKATVHLEKSMSDPIWSFISNTIACWLSKGYSRKAY